MRKRKFYGILVLLVIFGAVVIVPSYIFAFVQKGDPFEKTFFFLDTAAYVLFVIAMIIMLRRKTDSRNKKKN